MSLESYRTDSRQLPARARRDLAAIEHGALVRASQVQAVHFVGRFAMAAVADLTTMEEREGQASPTAAYRLLSVGDSAAAAINALILRMGMQ